MTRPPDVQTNVKARSARATPEPPPSPPPSRASCAGPEDPFRDPAVCGGSSKLRGNTCKSSCDSEERFSPVFTDDDADEPPPGKGKAKATETETQEEAVWRRVLREGRLLLTLENSGSVARDHLASERTFLAYVRTSLTLSSAGVALVQLFSLSAAPAHRDDLEQFARPLGAAMIGIGLYTLGVGVVRYFFVQEALMRGVYPVARVSTTLLSFAVLVMIIAVFVVVLIRM